MIPPLNPKHVPWQRYWVKHDGQMNLNDSGYLIAPPSKKRLFGLQLDVFPYEGISSKSFLALMGEVGAGKTDTIQRIAHQLEDEGQDVEYVALDLIDSTQELRHRLERTKSVAAAGKQATLFFDQYEVSSLNGPAYRHLVTELRDGCYRLENIKVRLGCRSGTWTADMEREFSQLWGPTDTSILELGFLTRDDVLTALRTVNTAPEDILDDLERRALVPLLTRPVTLGLILQLIEKGESVQQLTAAEVYRRGVGALIRPQPPVGSASEERERLGVAKRIAAASVFCGKHTVSMAPDDGSKTAGVMRVPDLVAGVEPLGGDDTVVVGVKALRDVIEQSGLFTLRGPGAFGWSHQSYAEYCAAEYVLAHEMPVEQVKGLLRLRDDGSPIVPELQGVASWLLTNGALPIDDDFIARWPTVVLRSDVQAFRDEQRASLAQALLEDADNAGAGAVPAAVNSAAHNGYWPPIVKPNVLAFKRPDAPIHPRRS